jgi:toxin ParE1/3/4
MAHRLAPEAASDLDDIWYYVARQSGSVEVADRLIDTIARRFVVLARNPHLGRRRDDDLRPGLRSFPVGSYVIIYRVEGPDVLILRVLWGGRDIPALFGYLGN